MTVKFSDLLVGSFFGTDGIDCYRNSIFVKTSRSQALCVWDFIGNEARGHVVKSIKPTLEIRETFSATFVDEQASNKKENTFKVKTNNGSFGIHKQKLAFSAEKEREVT